MEHKAWDWDEVEKKLGVQCQDKSRWRQALTHRSAHHDHNERLEFLGDAVLNLAAARIIFDRFPSLSEGKLTRMRAEVVNRRTLAKVAESLQLGSLLRLGRGEQSFSPKASICADSVEAIIAAHYLEVGADACQKQIALWFEEPLDALTPQMVQVDPKSRLQEYLQSKKEPLPVYELESVVGPSHASEFTVSCQVSILAEKVIAKGSSRRRAEQAAAQAVWEKMKIS